MSTIGRVDPSLVQFEIVSRLTEMCVHLSAADRISVLREFGAWILVELAGVIDEEPQSAGLLVAGLEAGLKVISSDVELRRSAGGAVETPIGEDAH